MPRHPEALSLLEQALRHVISEQEELLKRRDAGELTKAIAPLCSLALHTSAALAEGIDKPKVVSSLLDEATAAERIIDELSEELWTPIQVSVSAIYERAERLLKPEPGRYGFACELRAHYHNVRLRLLEQMLGARMLISISDLGEEIERIWQQFFEKHLGPMFRVLRGGYICDHEGNKSSQIDLIVVPADAHPFIPGDSEGGKAHVLIDQVVAAMMVTANLTVEKLDSDWNKLQSLPAYPGQEKDYPQLSKHPWPLCYILGAQSDAAEELESRWIKIATEQKPRITPQFVVSLSDGFLYSGLRRWPAPRYPGNYKEPQHVKAVTDLFGGLGLAWLLIQQQGRFAVIKGQTLGPITRFADLLDHAMMQREGVPATWSPRFDTSFTWRQIAGVMEWGSVSCFAHNRLPLHCIGNHHGVTMNRTEAELLIPGTDPSKLEWNTYTKFLRWFRHRSECIVGRLLAVEEWIDAFSKTDHKKRVAVFEHATGREFHGPMVDALRNPAEIENVRENIESELPIAEANSVDAPPHRTD